MQAVQLSPPNGGASEHHVKASTRVSPDWLHIGVPNSPPSSLVPSIDRKHSDLQYPNVYVRKMNTQHDI